MEKDTTEPKNNNDEKIEKYDTASSSIADHSGKSSSDQACIVYKFQSRPPYEGFVLILVIVVIIVLLIWWLTSKIF